MIIFCSLTGLKINYNSILNNSLLNFTIINWLDRDEKLIYKIKYLIINVHTY